MAVETYKTTEEFITHVKEHFCNEDVGLITKACAFTETYYSQIEHPLGISHIEYAVAVATIIDGLRLDPLVIAAALVYPFSPGSETFLDQLRTYFGDANGLVKMVEEARYVSHFEWNPWSMVTEQHDLESRKKMFFLTIEEEESKHPGQQMAGFFQSKEQQTENLIRMIIDLATDIRTLLIRLADHLCFITLLKKVAQDRKKALQYTLFAKLAITVYAPIADRLGLWQLKSQLEDMSFRLLEPDTYQAIAKQLADKKQEREGYIHHVITPAIEKLLKEFDIDPKISGRPKHIYSIHQKMEAKQLAFEHIHDLLGIRIIVETVEDCYTAQEVICTFWPPVREFYGGDAGRDWIASPKANRYQSLHTTISVGDKKVEIQIRTHEMHEIAEYGVAAQHWLYKKLKTYKKGRTPRVTRLRDQNWSKKLVLLRKHLTNELQSFEEKQEDDLRDRIFVITPKGHVIDLPLGATPLDFAYRIHTDLGHKYRGAKANGHLEHLDYTLKTGDIVEILTSGPNKSPSLDWLSQKRDEAGKSHYVYAQTSQARSKIRHQLNKPKS